MWHSSFVLFDYNGNVKRQNVVRKGHHLDYFRQRSCNLHWFDTSTWQPAVYRC